MPSNPTREGTRAAIAGPGVSSDFCSRSLARYVNYSHRETVSVGHISPSETLEGPVRESNGSQLSSEGRRPSSPPQLEAPLDCYKDSARQTPSDNRTRTPPQASPDDLPSRVCRRSTSLSISSVDADEDGSSSSSRSLLPASPRLSSSPSTATPDNKRLARPHTPVPPRGASPDSDDPSPTQAPGDTSDPSSEDAICRKVGIGVITIYYGLLRPLQKKCMTHSNTWNDWRSRTIGDVITCHYAPGA